MERMRRRVRLMKGMEGQFTVVGFQLSVGEKKRTVNSSRGRGNPHFCKAAGL
jgi:hypothetical protein